MALHVLLPNFYADVHNHEKLNNLSVTNTLMVFLACKETERRWFQERARYLQFLPSNYVISFVFSESSIKKFEVEEEMLR